MIKERLKELDIKITELANYLQISRPTMYKYIELYDIGKKKEVDKQVVKLFDYISTNDLIDKVNVINFIISKLIKNNNSCTLANKNFDFINKIKDIYEEDANNIKIKFIKRILKNSDYDVVMNYLLNIDTLLKKKKLLAEDEEKIKPYIDMLKVYVNTGDK